MHGTRKHRVDALLINHECVEVFEQMSPKKPAYRACFRVDDGEREKHVHIRSPIIFNVS